MLRSVLVDNFDAFIRLESDWNTLSHSVADSRYTQSFEGAMVLLSDYLSFSVSRMARKLFKDEQRAAIKKLAKRMMTLGVGLRPSIREAHLRSLPED